MHSLIRHGRRSIELQKQWHNLKPFQHLPATSNSFSSANSRKGKISTVSYLVDSLGLTRKLAESISRKVSFEDKRNLDSLLYLFRSHGFTDSQISSIITDYPALLILDADKSLAPKLKFLQSRSSSTSDLTEIVSAVPKMLRMKKDNTIRRYYDFVKDILGEEQVLRHSLAQGSMQENKIRNVLVLRELGVPQKTLFSLLISNFGTLCGKQRFEESLNKVVELGFDPSTFKFIQALNFIYALSDKTIEEKVNVYKKLGFSEEDVWEMFKKWPPSLTKSEKKILNSIETFLVLGFSRDEFVMMVKRYPPCIGHSADMVKKKTEFLVKKMNWPLKAIVSYPVVFGFSMEERILPRCNVIKALTSKGLFQGSELPLMTSVLVCSDQAFLKRYVLKHDDNKELVAELMAVFNGKEEKKAF